LTVLVEDCYKEYTKKKKNERPKLNYIDYERVVKMQKMNVFSLRKHKRVQKKVVLNIEATKLTNLNKAYGEIDNISVNETFDASDKCINQPTNGFFIKIQRTSCDSEEDFIIPHEFNEGEEHIAEDWNKRKTRKNATFKMTDLESNNGIYLTLITKELFKRNRTVTSKINKSTNIMGIELGKLLKRRKLFSDLESEEKKKTERLSINYPRKTMIKKTIQSPNNGVPRTSQEPLCKSYSREVKGCLQGTDSE